MLLQIDLNCTERTQRLLLASMTPRNTGMILSSAVHLIHFRKAFRCAMSERVTAVHRSAARQYMRVLSSELAALWTRQYRHHPQFLCTHTLVMSGPRWRHPVFHCPFRNILQWSAPLALRCSEGCVHEHRISNSFNAHLRVRIVFDVSAKPGLHLPDTVKARCGVCSPHMPAAPQRSRI